MNETRNTDKNKWGRGGEVTMKGRYNVTSGFCFPIQLFQHHVRVCCNRSSSYAPTAITPTLYQREGERGEGNACACMHVSRRRERVCARELCPCKSRRQHGSTVRYDRSVWVSPPQKRTGRSAAPRPEEGSAVWAVAPQTKAQHHESPLSTAHHAHTHA